MNYSKYDIIKIMDTPGWKEFLKYLDFRIEQLKERIIYDIDMEYLEIERYKSEARTLKSLKIKFEEWKKEEYKNG